MPTIILEVPAPLLETNTVQVCAKASVMLENIGNDVTGSSTNVSFGDVTAVANGDDDPISLGLLESMTNVTFLTGVSLDDGLTKFSVLVVKFGGIAAKCMNGGLRGMLSKLLNAFLTRRAGCANDQDRFLLVCHDGQEML
jgi:hypothetical protein